LRHLSGRTMLAVEEYQDFIVCYHDPIIEKLSGYAQRF
jgi:hypothetical protein